MLEYGATATLDTPMFMFAEDWLQRNPSAKVILSLRTHDFRTDAAVEQYWQSSYASLDALAPLFGFPFSFFLDFKWFKGVGAAQGITDEQTWWRPWWAPWISFCTTIRFSPQDRATEMFFNNIEHIRNVVPKNQLLEFSVRDGWKPLCEFLEVGPNDCPSASGEPFPHTNSRASMKVVFYLTRFIACTWPFLGLLPLLGIYLAVKCCCRCCCGGRNRNPRNPKQD